MSASAQADAVRRTAGLFRLEGRGLIEVRGGDATSWLDRMLSQEVRSLSASGPRSGCYALLLTAQGRIVADLHVMARPEALWLETEASFVAATLEQLGKLIVADDVTLTDRSGELARLGLEGPAAPAVLESAAGGPVALESDGVAELVLKGVRVVVAAFGWSGEPARQLLVPKPAAADVEAALREAGRAHGLVEASAEVLETLRVEAGLPRLGAELGEDVLPAEARLERAVSTTKGCYIGQEVVARMRSRGKVAHLMVGLAFEAGPPPAPGAAILAAGQRTGEVTSSARSERCGSIALGFVRSGDAEPETRVEVEGRVARVAALPFVPSAVP